METSSLYAQALGAAFADLAPALKRLHGLEQRRFTGVLAVRTGAHPLARLSLRLARVPRAQIDGDVLCHLCLLPSKRGECWRRYIGAWKFMTHQRLAGNPATHEGKKEIRERFGAIALRLSLRMKGESLWIRSLGMRVFCIPVPHSFAIKVVAYETPIDEGSFACNVRVYLPGLVALLQYRGTLKAAAQECLRPSAKGGPAFACAGQSLTAKC